MVYSCENAGYNHETQKTYDIFIQDKYEFPSQQNTVLINKDTSLQNINISISGMFGNTDISHLVKNGEIQLNTIPAFIRETAGTYKLLASNTQNIIDKSQLLILAGKIKGKSTNFIGPKTTPFEDTHGALITGFFQDSYNNLVDTTLALQYNLQIDDKLKIETIQTDHQYYFSHRIKPKNNKRQLIGIKSGNQFSDEMTVIGSSGCPITAEMSIYDRYNIADGRQLFTVQLDGFFDEGRHQIANGTSVSLRLKSKDYQSTYVGQIINGQVRFLLQNPNLAGRYFLEARSCNELIAKSESFYFKNSIQKINYLISGTILKIGPILSELNQIMPDGTPVLIESNSCPKSKIITLELEEGFALFNISELDNTCTSEEYTILINGVKKELLIKKEVAQ